MDRKPNYGFALSLLITSILIFLFTTIAYILVHYFIKSFAQALLVFFLFSILSGLAISYIVFSTTPALNNYYQNFRRLMRLESLSHPLLIKFAQKTPGTYQHTMTMANIATNAAKAIGANTLLTRIGAYYHDIGKMDAPENFVENQESDNIHDQIGDPAASAKIIINHVKHGLELAREYRLPDEIIDLIQQHHGTTLVSYFYNQALKLDPKTKKKDFRYPGPKPLSKEAAILMLADSIEATIRSEKNPNIDIIKKIINNSIEDRIEDRQLDYAGLTAAQLSKIKQSFLESIMAMNHQRISYKKN